MEAVDEGRRVRRLVLRDRVLSAVRSASHGSAFIAANRPPVVAALALILVVAGERPVLGTLTFLSVLTWSWASHVALHAWDVPLLSAWHHEHHKPEGEQSSPGGTLATEFLLNAFVLTGLFWALFVPPWLIHQPVLVYYAIVYTSLHLVNYHRDRKEAAFHELHHADPRTNYGPAFMDALMGTHQPPYEDIGHYLPNMVMAAILLLQLGFVG